MIKTDLTNSNRPAFAWLNEESRKFLQRGYLLPGTGAVQRIKDIADIFGSYMGDSSYSDKFYDYMSRGWFSLSSPIWSNYGIKDRALPISCFGSYIGDSISDIFSTVSEVGQMCKQGGGTSGYFGAIRPRGSKITNNGESNGSFSFSRLFDTTVDTVSQGSVRRGMFAGYIDIEHADIEEWLDIQTEGNPVQLIYYGVCVGDQWIEEMKAGDKYKRKIWAKILQRRSEVGIPFIFFRDNANNQRPDVYEDLNLSIHHTNMCTEIMLPNSTEESFVCCLMSMNALYFDEWKNTDAVKIAISFLDTVMTEFVDKTVDIPEMAKARRFAERHRALGLGTLGYHSYLQAHMIPFDSFEATQANKDIHKTIFKQAMEASKELAEKFSEPEILKGYGRRNTTLCAIAPTKSSSFILGSVSPSIEPFKSNYYVKDLAKSKTVYKNPFLESILREKGMDRDDVWDFILKHGGSVQELDGLSDEEKDVFKTFEEISQLAIIQQAAQRQKWVDQGQSINITIHPDTPTKDVNKLYLTAHELGLKSLYYQFSVSAAQKFNRELLTCSSCEA